MNNIDKLTEYFSKFPGIGPRQAKRFVYFLLTRNNGFLTELVELIQQLKKEIRVCQNCCRFYSVRQKMGASANSNLCDICADQNRDQTLLMVLATDADLTNIERIGNYAGLYFVLGGFVPILEKRPEQRIRIEKLLALVQKKCEGGGLQEIILALSVNPDGENTGEYVAEQLRPLAQKYAIKISALGRGLSTGAELEYLDNTTFQNALKNRS